MYGLTKQEELFLRGLGSPWKVQDFLDSLPFNFEKNGETCMSPRRVLKERKAHCIEGAMLACVAFLLQGRKPYILNLKVDAQDVDHVVVLYKEHGYWGAVSKTNHSVLRFRDPVYKSVRELAMSYFHEYFLSSSGKKTMLGYSRPINMLRFGKDWIVSEEDRWDIAEEIFDAPYTGAVPRENKKLIRNATLLERKAASIAQTKST